MQICLWTELPSRHSAHRSKRLLPQWASMTSSSTCGTTSLYLKGDIDQHFIQISFSLNMFKTKSKAFTYLSPCLVTAAAARQRRVVYLRGLIWQLGMFLIMEVGRWPCALRRSMCAPLSNNSSTIWEDR